MLTERKENWYLILKYATYLIFFLKVFTKISFWNVDILDSLFITIGPQNIVIINLCFYSAPSTEFPITDDITSLP